VLNHLLVPIEFVFLQINMNVQFEKKEKKKKELQNFFLPSFFFF